MGLGAATEAPVEQAPADEPNVTPEEQAAYEQFVTNGLSIIYPQGDAGEPVSQQVLDALNASDDPVLNLATATNTIVTQLEKSASGAGMAIDEEILVAGGAEIMEVLATVSETAGFHEYSQEDMDRATVAAMDMYVQQAQQEGRVEQQALADSFMPVAEADAAGKLDQVLPPEAVDAIRLLEEQQGAEQ